MATFFALLMLGALIAGIALAIQAVRRKQKMPRNGFIAFGVAAASFLLAGITAPPENSDSTKSGEDLSGQSTLERGNVICEAVSQAVVDAILEGTPNAKLENVQAVASKIYPGKYFVAGKLNTPKFFQGNSPVNAIWMTDGKSEAGSIMSANIFAAKASKWPDTSKTSLHITGTEPEPLQAQHCIDPSPPLELPDNSN